MREIIDATTRISDLVGAAKQYSQLDRAPFRYVDVTRASTPRCDVRRASWGGGGVRMVKDYDRSLPQIPPTRPSSTRCGPTSSTTRIDAMDGDGHAHRPHRRVDDRVLVEIGDTGPGIPPTSGGGSSSRSSPPRAWARAPASAWTSATG
jgi:hypothetical protein